MILPTFRIGFAATLLSLSLVLSPLTAGEWSVPLAGNTFHLDPSSGGRLPLADGALRLDRDREYSVYFHIDRPGPIEIAVEGKTRRGQAEIQAQVGDENFSASIGDSPTDPYSLGEVVIEKPGYVRVDLRSSSSDRRAAVMLSNLIVSSNVDGLKLDCVESNKGNMFYWGRRGPSVHLKYRLPQDTPLTYAYSEIMVPEGEDAMGTYFMANGFGEGYFGMQVNSDTERRVLFSVWSPFHTDNPADIPPEDRITTLAKGKEVHAQKFGNEGSGGQSYLVYPWKAGKTYRFLTEVQPDGDGNTRYTSWFSEQDADQWQLIASFRRPKTDVHLTNFHSFLENFSPAYGNVTRSAHYGNQWVGDTQGNWHEVTNAVLTGDNTARTRQRLDYAGGSESEHFFLRNCGFFSDRVELDQSFERAPSGSQPEVDLSKLPRS
ncbi:DUF3472 domain-containing protein [Allorhodopirellula solitaria]|uniref:DUF5077 domain-containing protein n=1 Tax=Allorhodopirellula solitaria TaxID=2527987 RepID=A0A5C5YCH6_9BACT|nr:DUF3472 domain-containing protein [Allorhodopirellula solitaria]TWT73080.1 hypothetical protein CA85_15460 [Allorhodopirellula solitaria]